jgi:hypothetical protein
VYTSFPLLKGGRSLFSKFCALILSWHFNPSGIYIVHAGQALYHLRHAPNPVIQFC